MDPINRKRILENIETLVQQTNYNKLIIECVNNGIITTEMQKILERDGHSKHKKLFEKITRRGPEAYDKLLSILAIHFKHAHSNLVKSPCKSLQKKFGSIEMVEEVDSCPTVLLNIEDPDSDQDIDQDIPPTITEGGCLSFPKPSKIVLKPYTEHTSFINTKMEVKRANEFGKHPKLPVYSMKSKNRGVFFLVNIINFDESREKHRAGAESDHDNLISLFRELGFMVFYYQDITRSDLEYLLEELLISDYLKHTDSFTFFFMSHGECIENTTYVAFRDKTYITVDEIITKFTNKNCSWLLQKPKLFFFPVCRGQTPDIGELYKKKTETDGHRFDNEPLLRYPTFSDILICYATVPGFKAHRDTTDGSWYVQALVKVFADHAHDCSIDDLLKLVDYVGSEFRSEDGGLQTASNDYRGFNKIMYFNPGIHDEL